MGAPVGERIGRALPLVLALPLLLPGACAHTPQAIPLHPMPKVAEHAVGKLLPVAVRVVDARPAPGAGRADVPSVRAARERFPITGDAVEAVGAQVLGGLERQGFRPAPAQGEGGERALTVEIRRLDHGVLSGFGSSDIDATAALTATARRPGGTYEVTHQVNEHRQVAFGPTRKDVAATVNGALEGALQRILEDDRLLDFLAGGT